MLLMAIDNIYGASAAEKVRAATNGDAGKALRYGGLVVGGWYPIEWYRALWDAVDSTLHVDETQAREIGSTAAALSVNRVYRMFSRLTSPNMLLRIAATAYKSYFDSGELRVRTDGTHSLIAEWRGCTGFNSLLWYDSLGGATYFLSSTGVADVKVTLISGGGDQDWAVARGSWR
jgi:hypothetical protein